MATRPTIKRGMSGKAGSDIGNAIFTWRQYIGLPPAAGVTVFDFGTQSHERTIAWQRKENLKADGVVGPATWARYDSLQFGPPTPAAVKAAEVLKAPEPPPPAAVKAAEVIKAKAPKPKPPPAAIKAAEKIAPAAPPAAVVMPKTVEEIKTVAKEASQKVVKVVEATPVWARVAGGVLGVVVAIKGFRKLFGMG